MRTMRGPWKRVASLFSTKRADRRNKGRLRVGRGYSRVLLAEPLEDRRMLAVLAVNSFLDNVTSDAYVTLREAIKAANEDSATDLGETGSGVDTIVFDPSLAGKTIQLTEGQLHIYNSVLIEGLGPNRLTVKADDPDQVAGNFDDPSSRDGHRIFLILRSPTVNLDNLFDNTPEIDVTISGLTLTGGEVAFMPGDPPVGQQGSPDFRFEGGGAILNYENLTLVKSVISNSHAQNGGGAMTTYNTTTIRDSIITNNHAPADSFFASGGIWVSDDWSQGATLEISGSELSYNTSGPSGGAIWSSSPLTIQNSTLSGNQSDSGGGAIFLYFFGSASISNSTITANAAQSGAGILNSGSGTVTLHSTIVAGNTELDQITANNIVGNVATASSYNLVGSDASQVPTGLGNIHLTGNDPLLGALEPNGGLLTSTHLPLTGSQAIDMGDPDAQPGVDAPLLDQRGWARKVGTGIDIGAVEVNSAVNPPGDYNNDGIVDAADYTVWRNNLGGNINLPNDVTSGMVTIEDYGVWKANYGSTETFAAFIAFSVLALAPGDYSADGVVDLADRELWENSLGSTTNLAADGNGNGIVDVGDLAIWQEHRGITTLDEIVGDYNNNGIVDGLDYELWVDTFGSETELAADGNGNGVVDAADYTVWRNNYGRVSAAMWPLVISGSAGVPFEIPDEAPQVTGVRLSGSESAHAAYDFSSVVGSGNQLRSVSVGGLETIHITFSEEVYVTNAALVLTNLQGASIPPVELFTYDLQSRTATWQFSTPLAVGQYLVQLSDSVIDLDWMNLDGEFSNPWTLADPTGLSSTFPSGDGEAGGDFEFRFTFIPADLARDNVVNDYDESAWEFNGLVSSGAQFEDGDTNGDGDIDYDDLATVQGSLGIDFSIWPTMPLAASPAFVVDSEGDAFDGDLTAGELTLREAVYLANHLPGHHTITFAPTVEEILLASELIISGYGDQASLDIVGPGADSLRLDAQNAYHGVFRIDSEVDVSISGLTITGGRVPESGGGIYSSGDLLLEGVAIVDNTSGLPNSYHYYLSYGGGGIYQKFGSLTIIDSTIAGNTALTDYFSGGGIYAYRTTVEIRNSTIDHNDAYWIGGLYLEDSYATVLNTTISTNASLNGYGGGVGTYDWLLQPTATFVNSTIAFNNGGTGPGGGIYVEPGGSSVTLINSIVASNYYDGGVSDVAGPFSAASHHNLVGVITGSTGLAHATTHYGNSSTPLEAGLAALGDYGGPTRTHALLAGSLAIDAGDDAAAAAYDLEFDQRGEDRTQDGDANTLVQSDLGAFELAADEYFGSLGA